MSIIVLIDACYIQYPLRSSHTQKKRIHTYLFLPSQMRNATTCKCLDLSHIYILSSASVHGKSLNMLKPQRTYRIQRVTHCM